jgi:hypothetical protein
MVVWVKYARQPLGVLQGFVLGFQDALVDVHSMSLVVKVSFRIFRQMSLQRPELLQSSLKVNVILMSSSCFFAA